MLAGLAFVNLTGTRDAWDLYSTRALSVPMEAISERIDKWVGQH